MDRMLVLSSRIHERIMKELNNFSIMTLDKNVIFPNCIPANNYGMMLFWAEEYWALTKIKTLHKLYPQIDFSGIIDPIFVNQLQNFMQKYPHEHLVGTNKYNDICDPIWENKRRIINISTSHAPSRFVAQSFQEKHGEHFAIITIDAHLDLSDNSFIHGAWLTEDLAANTTLIGGWAETKDDIEEKRASFAFSASDFLSLQKNKYFLNWLEGKKIYLTLDLDFFKSSNIKFLGYSNFWHRNKIIGHSMNIEQVLEDVYQTDHSSRSILLGKILGCFSDIESFYFHKNNSIKSQSFEIFQIIKTLISLCKTHSAEILSIDFVEYSPICDWKQLTINEFIYNYMKYYSTVTQFSI